MRLYSSVCISSMYVLSSTESHCLCVNNNISRGEEKKNAIVIIPDVPLTSVVVSRAIRQIVYRGVHLSKLYTACNQ